MGLFCFPQAHNILHHATTRYIDSSLHYKSHNIHTPNDMISRDDMISIDDEQKEEYWHISTAGSS